MQLFAFQDSHNFAKWEVVVIQFHMSIRQLMWSPCGLQGTTNALSFSHLYFLHSSCTNQYVYQMWRMAFTAYTNQSHFQTEKLTFTSLSLRLWKWRKHVH